MNKLKHLFESRWQDKCERPCDSTRLCSCFDWAQERYVRMLADEKIANHIDGYDRDDLGESPD